MKNTFQKITFTGVKFIKSNALAIYYYVGNCHSITHVFIGAN
jgi:hypothetical protein